MAAFSYDEIVANIYARLGLNSAAELAPVWTFDEVSEYVDDELKRLARDHGLFVRIAPPIATNANQAQYTLPSDCLAVVQAAFNNALLRPATVREAEALDANWTASTAAAPKRWLSDVGADEIRIYETPTGAGTLDLVYLGCAPDVGPTAERGLSPAIADLLEFVCVAECRRRESDAQMPEVAQVLDSLAGLYRTAIASYWGGGQ
jgi:hypothetical protein